MTGRPRQVEIIIVGGGPAGAAAAIVLAEAGRETLVAERSDYRAQRVGETLPPAANSILDRLGMAPIQGRTGYVRCPGTVCCWGDSEPYVNDFLFDPDGDGLHLDRRVFDESLAMRAARAGAEVMVNCRINKCYRRDNKWMVDVECGGEHSQYEASFLIDAAGRRKWRGRPGSRRAFDCQIALIAEFEVVATRNVDCRTWIEAASSGWWYSSVVPGNRLVAAYFTDADLLRASAPQLSAVWETLLQNTHWTRTRLSQCRPMPSLTIASASSTICTVIADEGYVAVGDAATTIDPLSSHGILYALNSGIDAAVATLQHRQIQALRGYALETARRFREDLRTRQYFYQFERRWPDSSFWQRRAQPTPLL